MEQGKEAEETRNHHIARIAELTGLLEDQEGQAALAAGPSMDRVKSDDGAMSLADELEEQNWKVKVQKDSLIFCLCCGWAVYVIEPKLWYCRHQSVGRE